MTPTRRDTLGAVLVSFAGLGLVAVRASVALTVVGVVAAIVGAVAGVRPRLTTSTTTPAAPTAAQPADVRCTAITSTGTLVEVWIEAGNIHLAAVTAAGQRHVGVGSIDGWVAALERDADR